MLLQTTILRFLLRFNMYDSYTSNILEVKRMSAMVHSIVEEQIILGVKPEKIILGGFSQGGALALYASLTCPVRIGGTFLLSAWMLAPLGVLRDGQAKHSACTA